MKISKEDQARIEASVLEGIAPILTEFGIHEGINFSNVRQLDVILNHLCASHLPASLGPHKDHLQLPNPQILKILLTLSTRIPQINYTELYDPNDITSLVVEKELQRDYTSFISIRDRSYQLLKYYLSLIDSFETIYTSFYPLFSEFAGHLEASKFSERTAKKSAKRYISTISDSVESSPKRKNVDSSFEASAVIDGSDDEGQIPPPTDIDVDIFNTHEKFLPSKKAATANASIKKAMESVKKIGSEVRSHSRSSTPVVFVDGRLFDDFLITYRLTPSPENKYSIWDLLRWTLYCAKQAILTTNSTSYHVNVYELLYRNYSDFMNLVWDFIQYDTNKFIEELCEPFGCRPKDLHHLKAQASHGSVHLYKDKLEGNRFLLGRFLLQLTTKQLYWYDRLVELVFAELDLASNSKRTPCYSKEGPLTLNFTRMNVPYHSEHVFDSFQLRYKIVFNMYKLALLHSPLTPVDSVEESESEPSESPMALTNALRLLSDKLLSLDPKFVRQFFKAAVVSLRSNNYEKHELQFIVLIIGTILSKLTDSNIYSKIESALFYFNRDKAHMTKLILGLISSKSILYSSSVPVELEDFPPLVEKYGLIKTSCYVLLLILGASDLPENMVELFDKRDDKIKTKLREFSLSSSLVEKKKVRRILRGIDSLSNHKMYFFM